MPLIEFLFENIRQFDPSFFQTDKPVRQFFGTDRVKDFPELIDLLIIETVGGNTFVLIEFFIIEILDLFIYFFSPFSQMAWAPQQSTGGATSGGSSTFVFDFEEYVKRATITSSPIILITI